MTHTLKIRQVGGALGVILPKELTNALNVQEGDQVFVTQGQEGFRIVADDPEFGETMKLYRETVGTYRNALRELAK